MQRIWENLQDPSWWFTAILIAIITSLFASFLRDWIGSLLSSVSARIHSGVAARQTKEQHLVEKIAADPVELIIYAVRAGIITTLFGITFGWYLAFPIFWTTLKSPTFMVGSMLWDFPRSVVVARLATTMLGVCACLFGYRSVSVTRRFARAIRLYRQTRDANQSLEA